MDSDKVKRLNVLFEKVLAESANIIEQKELELLYKEFFEDGREQLGPIAVQRNPDNSLAG
ncbi:hypothetical protein [Thalassotalea marina]|nr:hypothetical protein [Thalassotalea marina]